MTHPDKDGWIDRVLPVDMDTVRADFKQYQEWLDNGDVRSFMCDRLHENIRFLLDHMNEVAGEAAMEASRFAVGE